MKKELNKRGVSRSRQPRVAAVRLPSGRAGVSSGRLATEPAPAPNEVVPLVDGRRGDALELYLREIGPVKLLTPKEEIQLARRIKRGDQAARELMIKSNLKLVVKIARDYEGMGVPLLDLISEGNIGLMKGVERFKPGKGAKLSTYASWWIKQAIKRALADQGKTIRLPVHVVDRLAHIRKAEVRLREAFGREATDEELAHELDLDSKRIRQYRDASRAPVSLDAPIGDEADTSVSEVVADPNAAAPFAALVRDTDTDLMREVMGTLSERESTILGLRFGLNDGRERTLDEIGQQFGVTRERIRQIQELALKKLRRQMEKRDRPEEESEESFAVAA